MPTDRASPLRATKCCGQYRGDRGGVLQAGLASDSITAHWEFHIVGAPPLEPPSGRDGMPVGHLALPLSLEEAAIKGSEACTAPASRVWRVSAAAAGRHAGPGRLPDDVAAHS